MNLHRFDWLCDISARTWTRIMLAGLLAGLSAALWYAHCAVVQREKATASVDGYLDGFADGKRFARTFSRGESAPPFARDVTDGGQ